jgi:pilus assembly protein CpaE
MPSESISVLIVDDIPETRENLRKLLYFESDIEIVGTAENGRQAIDKARTLQPNIILMDINMPDMDGITASQEIGKVAPRTQVIMMSVQSEADYLRRSMLAGAMDVLTKPFTSEELSSSIHRVYEMGASRRASTPSIASVPAGSSAGPFAAERRPLKRGKLLLVYSPKGGTGCSLLASNLAIALAQVTSKQVALIDASLQFGDVNVLLNLQSSLSMVDATSRLSELDADLVNALTTLHPSGLRVLPAPPTPVAFERISPDGFKRVVSKFLDQFDYVVLDTWSYLDDIVLAGIDLAERILVVMTPEIPSVKSTKQFFEITEALEFPSQRIDLILNKVIPRDGVRAEQIEENLKHGFAARFDFEPKGVRQTINQGLPLVLAQPNHPISQSCLRLAQYEVIELEPKPAEEMEEVMVANAEPQRRAGLFGRLKK